MAKKDKKKLTTKQEQAKHRAQEILCYIGMGLGVITPALIYGGINFDEWFVQNPEGYKIGIGAGIGLAVTAVAIFFISQRKEKNLKVTDGWITFIICWFAIGFALKLFGDIITEIANVVLWTGAGLCVAFGLDLTSKSEKRKADAYKTARAKVEQETIEEKAKREVEEEQGTPVD